MPPSPRTGSPSADAGAPRAPRGQTDAFARGEADAYFARNHADEAALDRDDPLFDVLSELEPAPARWLEVGCSDGARLERLRRLHGDGVGSYAGLDPSARAIAAGRERFPQVSLQVATADALPFHANSFDVVVFGFCLYLCDRADLFRIAAECDRVLDGDGLVVVYDFHREAPHANPYAHAPGLHSYKMDHARLFTWNPAYGIVDRRRSPYPPDDEVAVTVLRRSISRAWHPAPHGDGDA